jgi:hypothetical protein
MHTSTPMVLQNSLSRPWNPPKKGRQHTSYLRKSRPRIREAPHSSRRIKARSDILDAGCYYREPARGTRYDCFGLDPGFSSKSSSCIWQIYAGSDEAVCKFTRPYKHNFAIRAILGIFMMDSARLLTLLQTCPMRAVAQIAVPRGSDALPPHSATHRLCPLYHLTPRARRFFHGHRLCADPAYWLTDPTHEIRLCRLGWALQKAREAVIASQETDTSANTISQFSERWKSTL